MQWKVAPESLGRLDWPLPAKAVQAAQEAPQGSTGGTGCLSLACCPDWAGPLVGDAEGRIWQLSVGIWAVQPDTLASCDLTAFELDQPPVSRREVLGLASRPASDRGHAHACCEAVTLRKGVPSAGYAIAAGMKVWLAELSPQYCFNTGLSAGHACATLQKASQHQLHADCSLS